MEEGVDMENEEDEAEMEPGDLQDDEGEEAVEEAQFDYEQMDLKICGDLSKLKNDVFKCTIVEKNKKLDEFFMA